MVKTHYLMKYGTADERYRIPPTCDSERTMQQPLPTRQEALDAALAIDPDRPATHVASIRMATGYAAYAARNALEAVHWINCNKGWFYPGSDQIHKISG